MNAEKPILSDINYIIKEYKIFNFIANNIQYNVLIKKNYR